MHTRRIHTCEIQLTTYMYNSGEMRQMPQQRATHTQKSMTRMKPKAESRHFRLWMSIVDGLYYARRTMSSSPEPLMERNW